MSHLPAPLGRRLAPPSAPAALISKPLSNSNSNSISAHLPFGVSASVSGSDSNGAPLSNPRPNSDLNAQTHPIKVSQAESQSSDQRLALTWQVFGDKSENESRQSEQSRSGDDKGRQGARSDAHGSGPSRSPAHSARERIDSSTDLTGDARKEENESEARAQTNLSSSAEQTKPTKEDAQGSLSNEDQQDENATATATFSGSRASPAESSCPSPYSGFNSDQRHMARLLEDCSQEEREQTKQIVNRILLKRHKSKRPSTKRKQQAKTEQDAQGQQSDEEKDFQSHSDPNRRQFNASEAADLELDQVSREAPRHIDQVIHEMNDAVADERRAREENQEVLDRIARTQREIQELQPEFESTTQARRTADRFIAAVSAKTDDLEAQIEVCRKWSAIEQKQQQHAMAQLEDKDKSATDAWQRESKAIQASLAEELKQVDAEIAAVERETRQFKKHAEAETSRLIEIDRKATEDCEKLERQIQQLLQEAKKDEEDMQWEQQCIDALEADQEEENGSDEGHEDASAPDEDEAEQRSADVTSAGDACVTPEPRYADSRRSAARVVCEPLSVATAPASEDSRIRHRRK